MGNYYTFDIWSCKPTSTASCWKNRKPKILFYHMPLLSNPHWEVTWIMKGLQESVETEVITIDKSYHKKGLTKEVRSHTMRQLCSSCYYARLCGKPGHHAPQCKHRKRKDNPLKANLTEWGDTIDVVNYKLFGMGAGRCMMIWITTNITNFLLQVRLITWGT